MSRKQKIYWRRQALLTDLFLTGSNALTQKGQLVNLDMIGNRVGGITFGPKHVVLFIGINKITANLEEAMHRVRTIAAPRNAIRHEGFRTPCHKTGVCMDCNSPDRICNVWTITEKELSGRQNQSHFDRRGTGALNETKSGIKRKKKVIRGLREILPDNGKAFSSILISLKTRNFRLYFTGMCVSLTGTWMQQIAMSWLVYRLTGSVFLLATVTFMAQIPILLVTPS